MTHYSRTLTSEDHYDARSCAGPLLSPAKSFVKSFTLFRTLPCSRLQSFHDGLSVPDLDLVRP